MLSHPGACDGAFPEADFWARNAFRVPVTQHIVLELREAVRFSKMPTAITQKTPMRRTFRL